MRLIIAIIAWIGLWTAASAQTIVIPPSNGNPITPTSITLTSAAPPTTITINPSNQSTFGTFEINVNGYDYGVNGPADARWFMVTSILSPSTATSHVWEQLNSFAEYNGTGAASGEINLMHAYFQMDASSSMSGNVETFESSALNNGGLTGTFVGNLDIFTNGVAGTATFIAGSKYQLTNNNATGGAITTYAAIDIEPILGGGSAPSTYAAMRINDATAPILTKGNISIGSLSTPTSALYVQGPDTSSGTFPFLVKNSTPANVFFVDDAGDATATNSVSSPVVNATTGFKANGTLGVSTTCTVTAGNTLVFSEGILTTKGANCT